MKPILKKLAPESLKVCYRTLRAFLLSLTLRPSREFTMGAEERDASKSISVVVAVHDSPEVTRRCLQSLEIFGGDAEIIVVDDGSKLDQTKKLLEEFCARNEWKLLRNAVPQGHSRASEAGVEASVRPFVCLLNSDTVVTPRSWAAVLVAFGVSPRIAVVGPSTSYSPGPQLRLRACHCRHYWSDRQIWSFAEIHAARHAGEALVEVPFLGGFAFFVRRTAWDELGGFDKNLPDYGNETELCRRFLKAEWRLAWAKGAYIHHFGNESYGRVLGRAQIIERSSEAETYLRRKHGVGC